MGQVSLILNNTQNVKRNVKRGGFCFISVTVVCIIHLTKSLHQNINPCAKIIL